MAANPKALGTTDPLDDIINEFRGMAQAPKPAMGMPGTQTPGLAAPAAPSPAMGAPANDPLDDIINEWKALPKPEPGLWQKAKNTGRALKEGVRDSWPEFKAQFGKTMEAGKPFDDQNQYDEWQAQANATRQGFLTEPGGQDPTLLDASVGQMKGEVSSNFPQTGAMLAGAALGAPFGGIPGALMGAGIAGTANLVPMYYGAKTDQVRNFADIEDANRLAQGKPAMTLPEKQVYQTQVQPEAETQAAWETAPELIGMAAGLTPLGMMMKPVKGPLLKSALSMAGLKAMGKGALIEGASILPGEIGEEAVTAIGQRPIEQQHVMPGQPVPKSLGWNVPDFAEAFQERALPTVRGMLPMVALGMGAGAYTNVQAGRQRYNDAQAAVRAAAEQTQATGIPHTAAVDPENPEQFTVTPSGLPDTATPEGMNVADYTTAMEGEPITPQQMGAALDEVSNWWNRQSKSKQARALNRLGVSRKQAQQQNLLGIHFDLLPDELKTEMATRHAQRKQNANPIQQTPTGTPIPEATPDTQTANQGPMEAPKVDINQTTPTPTVLNADYIPIKGTHAAHPLSGYLGNKKTMVDAGAYDGIFPVGAHYQRLVEPFGGSGYLGNVLQNALKPERRVLNDLGKHTHNFHQQVKDNPGKVASHVNDLLGELDTLRPDFENTKLSERVIGWWKQKIAERETHPDLSRQAAWTLIQNNGSIAVMGKSQRIIKTEDGKPRWNVSADLPQRLTKSIHHHANALKNADVYRNDAAAILDQAGKGDLVLVDPPYADAAGYAEGKDLETIPGAVKFIIDHVGPAAARGAQVVYTNYAKPEIIAALKSAGLNTKLIERRSQRGNKTEVVAWNHYPNQSENARRGTHTAGSVEQPRQNATGGDSVPHRGRPGSMAADDAAVAGVDREQRKPGTLGGYGGLTNDEPSRQTVGNPPNQPPVSPRADSDLGGQGSGINPPINPIGNINGGLGETATGADNPADPQPEPIRPTRNEANGTDSVPVAGSGPANRAVSLQQPDTASQIDRATGVSRPAGLGLQGLQQPITQTAQATGKGRADLANAQAMAFAAPGMAQAEQNRRMQAKIPKNGILEEKQDEPIIEHVTQKGHTIKGVVRTGITQEQAAAIDPLTFKKDGGWFIREKHVLSERRGNREIQHKKFITKRLLNLYRKWKDNGQELLDGADGISGYTLEEDAENSDLMDFGQLKTKGNARSGRGEKQTTTREFFRKADLEEALPSRPEAAKPSVPTQERGNEKQPNLDTVSDDPEMAKLQAEMFEAMKEVGEAFVNLNPFVMKAVEVDSAKMLPALTKVMDIAFRMGYHSFKKNAQFVLAAIRKQFGNEAADALTLRQVKGAYNFMAEGKALADDEDAVAAVKTLDEITQEVPAKNAETEEEKTEPQAAIGDWVKIASTAKGFIEGKVGKVIDVIESQEGKKYKVEFNAIGRVETFSDHNGDKLEKTSNPYEEAKPESQPKPESGNDQTPPTAENPTILKDRDAVAKALADDLILGKEFATIVEARKRLTELTGEAIQPGTAQAKQADETIELAGVLAARWVVGHSNNQENTYDRLVRLTGQLPNLSQRTSTSVEQQAYSTPLPLAYVASRLAEVKDAGKVLEPTAGNGALLIEATPKQAVVNELNSDRRKALQSQGFTVSQEDASKTGAFKGTVDAVIANPPFGVVRDENGVSREFQITPQWRTTEIDHAIAMNALSHLDDNGRAVLIVGAPAKTLSEKGRSDAYNGKAKRAFYFTLYRNYNVTNHFTVSGALYAQQGAAWPVDVIVIKGRGKSARALPAAELPNLINSWEELKNELPTRQTKQKDNATMPVDAGTVEEGTRPGNDDAADQKPAGRGRTGAGATDNQPGELLPELGASPQTPRPDGDQLASAEPKELRDRDGTGGESDTGGVGLEQETVPENPERERIARLYAEALGEKQNDVPKVTPFHLSFADAIIGKKAYALQFLANGLNNVGKRVFSQVTGIKLPKTQSETWKVLREWGGIDESFDNLKELRHKVKVQEDYIDRTIGNDALPALNQFRDLIEKGFNKVVKGGKHGTETWLINDQNQGYNLSQKGTGRAKFIDWLKAELIYQEAFNAAHPELTENEQNETNAVPTPERGNERQEDGTPSTSLANDVPKQERGNEGNPFQSTYTPSSQAKSVGTLVPRNLATATANALAKVAEKHGSVDAYVAKSLNYKPQDIPTYFSAEQVDALALILDNLEQGKGFIIGDQTGVGKGRVVAATIRWAIINKKAPIFVTEKPALYSDMLRDLADIGQDNINPIVTNIDVDIPLDDEARRWYELAEKAKEKGERPPARFGEFLKNPSPGVHARALAEMTETGEMKDYNVIFTTYNQMQTVAGKTYPRHSFLNRMADGGVVIFDESHNAGGTVQRPSKKGKQAGQDEHGGRAHMARQMAKTAHGVLYSSATYAKRPEVMDLYFRTDMGKVGDADKLRGALEAGGVPLQQVVAAMLAESGQYIRREKSFDGIAYDTVPAPVNRAFAENSATIMRDILEFDRLKIASIEAIDKNLKAEGKIITGDKSTGGAGASSTNFTSVMHNLISQMLLMMKVEATAQEAIAALQRGEKPVIAVANTMGAAIQEYADEVGIKPGDPLPLSFADLLKRYLQKSRRVTEGEAYGKKTSRELTDEELGPFAVAHYKATVKRIDAMGFRELPISPIDAIRQQIEAAGFKTGEITGRTARVDYSKPTAIFRRRGADEVSTAGKRKTITNFNAGKLDAVIINQSGATGISLHASERNPKAGQAKRVMIIAQPELNIDTHMQILGRVNRTGQVVLPSYIQLVADIPAEKRPAAVLAKKMAMLNANTSANKRSAVTAKDVPDFMNQYGDQVAAQVMWDNEEWHKALGEPLDPPVSAEGYEPDGAIRKVTGRIPLLPLKVQEEVYAEIEQSYNDLIDQLDRMGENALEARTLDLDAKTVNTVELLPKVDNSGSPFSEALNAEELDIKHQGKPMTLEEIDRQIYGPFAKEDDPQAALKQHYKDIIAQTGKALTAYDAALVEKHSQDEDGKGLQADQARVQLHRQKANELLRDYPVGTKVFLKTLSGYKIAGVIGKIERKGRTVSPVAPSAWKVTFYLADPMRQVTLPLSKLGFGEQDEKFYGVAVLDVVGATAQEQHTQQFEEGQSISREKRVMLTGNLLAGYSTFGNGRIVHYTTKGGGIKQGVMMGKADKLDSLQASQPVSFATPELAAGFVGYRRKDGGAVWLEANDKQMRLTVDDRPNAILTVPASKADGGKYFLDAGLRAAIGDDFYKHGDRMQANFPQRQLDAVLNRLYELGVRFEVTTYKEEAREYLKDAGASEGNGAVRYSKLSQSESLYAKRPSLPFKGMTKQAAQGVVDHYLKGLKGLGGLKIQVFGTQNEAGRGSNRQPIEAEFHIPTQTLRVIAENHKNPAHLLATLREEIVGHYGLRQLLGDEHTHVMREVERAAKANPEFRAQWVKLSGRDPRTGEVLNRRAPYFSELARYDKAEIADEVISKLARNGVENGWMRRIIDLITRLLRKVGVIRGPMTRREMMALLARSERGLRGSGQWTVDSGQRRGNVKGGRYSVPAWHGSPHDFDEFKLQHIGSGEGAQVYGWGLYFASSKEVGKYYKDALSKVVYGYYTINDTKQEDIASLDWRGPILEKAKEGVLNEYLKSMKYGYDNFKHESADLKKEYEYAQSLLGKDVTFVETGKRQGKLYQVDLTPDHEDFLDWDKPLSEQSKKVIAALNKAGIETNPSNFGAINKTKGGYYYITHGGYEYGTRTKSLEKAEAQLSEIRKGYEHNGHTLYSEIAFKHGSNIYSTEGNKAASQYLLSIGIPGITYKDATARGTDKASYNYVIFDDSLVKIQSRYAKGVPTQELGNGQYLAPNGKPSNLNPTQWAQVRTPEFKAWFGDWENDPENASKVVDENGEPRVVYHGGYADITAFNKRYRGATTGTSDAEKAFFFAGRKADASLYSDMVEQEDEDNESDIYDIFLSLKNPLMLGLNDESNLGEDLFNELSEDDTAALSYAEDEGYDGVLWPNGSWGNSAYTAAVFEPEQIKSATSNTGSFSPTNPDIRYSKAETATDREYLDAVERGDMETAQRMVNEAAERSGLETIEDGTAFSVSRKPTPKKTIKAYKKFSTVNGQPRVLFVGGTDTIPVGVWLDAIEPYWFKAANGRDYVPTVITQTLRNGKLEKGKMGSAPIPNDQVRQELIKRGYLPEGSKAKAVPAVARRPGWHLGEYPLFPQGGRKIDGRAFDTLNNANDVYYEVEIDATQDYTQEAEATPDGDLKYLPNNGYYRYFTNAIKGIKIGDWFIADRLKVVRPLTEQEVNSVLAKQGIPAQGWDAGLSEAQAAELDFDAIGVDPKATDERKKLLDPVTYDDDGNVIPLSQRFNPETSDVRYSKSTPIDPLDPNAAPVFADRVDGYSLSHLKDIPKFVKANLKGMRALGLKTLGRQWLTEIYQDDLPGLKAHNRLMMAFDADPNERQARAGDVSQEWGGLQREDADSLADIMHVSTVHGVDASKEAYEPRYTPEQVQADFYAELNEVWDVYRKKRAVVRSTQGNPPNDVMYEWQKALSDLTHMTFLKAETLDKMAQDYQKRGIQPDWEDSQPVQKGLKRRIRQRMKAEAERKAEWERMQSPWRKLSPKARELYATARDMYQQLWRDTEQALIERIERTMPEGGSERNKMIDRMRLIFRREVPEVYFPLHRDGEYVVVVKTAPDSLGFRKNVGVFREQSLAHAERLQAELRERYKDTTHEVMPIFKQPTRTRREAADSAFVAQVINLIGVEGGGHKMDQLRENVMELYYQALPDLSWAKHEMHRRKVPGYSRDARKAFAHHISHGANHLARIRYIDRLEKSLDEMQEFVDGHKYAVGDDWDAVKAQDLVNSLKQRHEFAMNPPNVPLANKLTSFGFVWYLGLSPASAIVNALQTPLVAGPVLGSKFGLLKSTGALVKASGEVMKALRFEGGRGIKGVSPSEQAIVSRLKAALSEDEFKAIEKAMVDGHATVTLAHDLAGVAQGKEHGETMEAVLRAASFMFHQTELFNRLTTILAAYRLGRAKGLSHGGAYSQAIDLNYMSHFDYAANNRAPVIAGPVARVVTQFKQYQLNSITLWAHNGVQALLAMPNFLRGKGMDERQKEAVRLFRGLLVTHALAAGVLGLPMVGTFLAVASALGGDDDEPWDAEAALRNSLADWTSPAFAEAVAHGVPRLGRHVLPNALAPDIAERVGMDRLLFPDLQEGLEPVQWYKEFAVSMLGPVVGAGLNAAKGMQTWGDGDWARGLEEMSPKVVKDALKSIRYAREGVKDKTGVEILDETSWGEIASQLTGFTPARVSEAMESRGAVYNLDRRLTKRRSELMDEYADAVMHQEPIKGILAEIREFNASNPQMKITPQGMRQSMKNRRKRINEAEGGVYLPPKRKREREVGRFFQG